MLDTAFLCLAIGLNSSAYERENAKAVRRTIAWLILIAFFVADGLRDALDPRTQEH